MAKVKNFAAAIIVNNIQILRLNPKARLNERAIYYYCKGIILISIGTINSILIMSPSSGFCSLIICICCNHITPLGFSAE